MSILEVLKPAPAATVAQDNLAVEPLPGAQIKELVKTVQEPEPAAVAQESATPIGSRTRRECAESSSHTEKIHLS